MTTEEERAIAELTTRVAVLNQRLEAVPFALNELSELKATVAGLQAKLAMASGLGGIVGAGIVTLIVALVT